MRIIHTRGDVSYRCRHLDLDSALATIAEVGFAEIDLGALPGFRPRAAPPIRAVFRSSCAKSFREFLCKEH